MTMTKGDYDIVHEGCYDIETKLKARVKRLEREVNVAAKICASVADPNDDQAWDWPGLASRFKAALAEGK